MIAAKEYVKLHSVIPAPAPNFAKQLGRREHCRSLIGLSKDCLSTEIKNESEKNVAPNSLSRQKKYTKLGLARVYDESFMRKMHSEFYEIKSEYKRVVELESGVRHSIVNVTSSVTQKPTYKI